MTSILTGDLINSRKKKESSWLKTLKMTLETFGTTPKNWQIYRGDSFQLEISNPEESFFSALKIKANLKSIENIDVRIGIGIGKKEFNASKITEANGEVFINSGIAFDNYLKKQTLAIKTPWQEIDDEFNLFFELALMTIDNWTINSAEIFKISTKNKEAIQKDIAALLGISQGSVSERQKRAGIEPIMKLETHFRKQILKKISQ